MPLGQFDERLPYNQQVSFTDSDTPGTYKVLAISDSNDLRLDVFQASNSDSIVHNLLLSPSGSVGHDWVSVEIPAGSGWGATPPVDLLAFMNPSAYHYLTFTDNDKVEGTVAEAINTGKVVSVWTMGGFV